MKKNWHYFEQGTAEWKNIRCGKVTASMVSDVLAGGTGKSRENAMADLVSEILTGKPTEDTFSSFDMERGKELEPIARAAYEERTGEMILTVGFIDHPSIPRYGASPDGIIEHPTAPGGLELKCPKRATHLAYLQGGAIPKNYRDQIEAQMDCGDLAWVDFVSFCPDFPPNIQLFIKRFHRDENSIMEKRLKIQNFISEAEELAGRLAKGVA